MALGTLQAFGDAWFEVSELSLRDIVGIPNSDTSEILLGSFGKRVMPCASLYLHLGTKIKITLNFLCTRTTILKHLLPW